MTSSVYTARSAWVAAWLLVNRVPLLGAATSDDGFVVFRFDNVGDEAWKLAQEWRDEIAATVNGPALVRAHREINAVINQTRQDGEYTHDIKRPTAA